MKKSAAVIMGYGVPPNIFTDDNYQRYLRAALQRVIVPQKITRLILCGGHTNIHYPKKTEAASMLGLLQYLLPEMMSQITCDLVEDSITGRENLEAADIIIRESGIEKVYIICEKTRAAKVRLTARFTLPKDFPFEVIGIDFDATRNLLKDAKQYLGSIVILAEQLFPSLRRGTRRRQLRHIQAVSEK